MPMASGQHSVIAPEIRAGLQFSGSMVRHHAVQPQPCRGTDLVTHSSRHAWPSTIFSIRFEFER